jgi:osmotically inducible protein OsmC
VAVRRSSAEWKGTLKEGSGLMRPGTGSLELPFSFSSRFESGQGSNPEELIGAAHAGCYSMFLAALLTEAGFKPVRIATTATVRLEEGPRISLIELRTEAEVPELTDAAFQRHALSAKNDCPVSKALTGPAIRLTAKLLG